MHKMYRVKMVDTRGYSHVRWAHGYGEHCAKTLAKARLKACRNIDVAEAMVLSTREIKE